MVTSDPQLIRNILIKDFHKFGQRPTVVTPYDHPIYRYVIDNTDDKLWQRIRLVMKTVFTDRTVESLAKKIDNNLVDLTNELDNQLVGQSAAAAVVDIRQLFINQTIDMLGLVMFSWKQNTFNDPNNRFNQIMKRLFFPKKSRILAQLVLPKFILQALNMTSTISTEALDDFTDLIVGELAKRRNNNNNNNKKPNFLSTHICDDFFQSLLNRCPEFIGNKTQSGKTSKK
ncbi:cytochrome P450 6d1-like [Oppia nitens]|uniref:cytochrome P450 6d1-like n=1 Tax=Oppia nitens TaxID=1686743 RepID=UPI0023D9B260|nr:cytochrome P450 6d1-like [Oppia nitens]